MGSHLPVISGKEAVAVFTRLGWEFKRQSGSHMVLTKPDMDVNLSIPNHSELDTGLLRGQIRKAGLTVEEFIKAMDD